MMSRRIVVNAATHAQLLAKQFMTAEMKRAQHFDAVNTAGVLTCCSAILMLPSLIVEGPAAWATLRSADDGGAQLGYDLFLCGCLYYAYNECGFRVLEALGSVSQAVANSAKRVVALVFAVHFLGESTTTRSLVGAAVAIAGVMCYSLAKLLADQRVIMSLHE